MEKIKEEYPNQRIYERDKFKCQYCGLDTMSNFDIWWHANLSIDHVRPKRHGGDDSDSNLVVSCHTCNLYKGSTFCETLEEARNVVAKKRLEAEIWFKKYVH